METFFDSRLDLLQRNLAKHSDRLKVKAGGAFQEMFKKDFVNKLKSPSGEILADNLEREMQKFKLKVRRPDASAAPLTAAVSRLDLPAHDLAGCLMAVGQNRPHARKDHLHVRRHVPPLHRPYLRNVPAVRIFLGAPRSAPPIGLTDPPQMDAHLLHAAGGIPAPHAGIRL